MTATEKMLSPTVAGASSLSELESKIIRQIEYYFGDFNLVRDKFLKDIIETDQGWVPIDTMLKFQRLSKISSDASEILSSLKKSESGLMEVDEESFKIRRRPSIPLPKEEEAKKEQSNVTIYMKGFEKDKTTLDDLLEFFNKYDNVVNVFRRTWLDKKSKERFFKGSVFVTFKDRQNAEKFMDLESVKNPEGEELVRKWQEDYNEEKKKDFEEKHKKVQQHKAGAKKVKEMVEKSAADQEKENLLPKGAVLKLEGLNETTTREIIREKLEKDFGVTHENIAFIDYSKGETMALLRFKEENAAKDLLAKMDKEGLEVNRARVILSVLEGEAETVFLDKCLADMTESRGRSRGGHKRRGGFQGGRGGSKRSRH